MELIYASNEQNDPKKHVQKYNIVIQDKFDELEGKIKKDRDVIVKELYDANQNMCQLIKLINGMDDCINDNINDGGKLHIENLT